MAAPHGIAAQVGVKTESVVGTAVTVDKFLPFLSEGVKQDIARLDSMALRAGRRTTHGFRPGGKTIQGPLNLELPNVDIAMLLKHVFGAVVTTGSGPYTHTYTPGDLTGKSFTYQVGRPDTNGTVQPYTYAGCKIASAELACSAGELASLTVDISAMSETTATALAAAAYTAGYAPFSFVDGALTIAAVAVATVQSATLSINNNLAVDRHRFNSASVREQLQNGLAEFTGSIVTDFESLTAYNRFVNADQAAMVLSFTNGADSLTITMNVRFDGETPEVGGVEMLKQSLPFKCLSPTSDAAAITAALVNTDASAA
jgi:hypothetical protein